MPGPEYAAAGTVSGIMPGPAITRRIGREYSVAKAKSRSSWAGTDMIAPVPYSISTKLATQIGTRSPEKGLIAYAPVNRPSLSPPSDSRWSRVWFLSLSTNSPKSGSGAVARKRSTRGCSGARATKVAP